jgi:hypothetical protein
MLLHSPGKVILIGFFLVLLGVIIPVLMVTHVIEPSYLLSFVSFGASVSGLFLGIIGAAMYSRKR